MGMIPQQMSGMAPVHQAPPQQQQVQCLDSGGTDYGDYYKY